MLRVARLLHTYHRPILRGVACCLFGTSDGAHAAAHLESVSHTQMCLAVLHDLDCRAWYELLLLTATRLALDGHHDMSFD